jgi:hypothetical protein
MVFNAELGSVLVSNADFVLAPATGRDLHGAQCSVWRNEYHVAVVGGRVRAKKQHQWQRE